MHDETGGLPLPESPTRPFRYEGGTNHRPAWLESDEISPAESKRLADLWLPLVSYVANSANESGLFIPEATDWLVWSTLSLSDSVTLARRLERLGALTRSFDRLYVTGWRDVYRLP